MPTKPDSRATLILTTIAHECERLGHALSLTEAREALTAAGHPVPKSFTAEVGSLRRRGLLVSSGRRGALRYAPKGFVARERGPRTDAEIVYDALVRATRRAGTMVSTNAVTREIRRRGWTLATTRMPYELD